MTGGRILVVEDAIVNRKLIERLLRQEGHAVTAVGDGLAALEALGGDGEPPFDVVLLDLVMPGLDGYATLARMKADSRVAHLPVIVISAVEELDSVVRCIELGALDYLPKPVEPTILQARLNAALSAKRLRDLEVEVAAQQAELLRTIARQKEELSRFLSPQIAALVSSPEGERLLAGHRREATTVFCDLRGFTSFSEAADPEEVLGVLRGYHAMMGSLIVEHGGTLEHFAGDGMMVFFNDPVLQEDHVLRSVHMAVAMRERFAELASGWAKRGHKLGFGVGIATGHATLGRIGFEGRYDYGMVGMAVIVASRLSSAAEAGQILLAPRSHDAVADQVVAEPIGEIQLKGMSNPIAAVNVLGLRGAGKAGVSPKPAMPEAQS
ncbi:MAG: adenylate/guanylate cyclase domain-containing response regulator [Chloroflexota bacterium]